MGRTPPTPGHRDELVVLILGYHQGNLDALERLYAELAPRLRSYLVSLAGDPTSTQHGDPRYLVEARVLLGSDVSVALPVSA